MIQVVLPSTLAWWARPCFASPQAAQESYQEGAGCVEAQVQLSCSNVSPCVCCLPACHMVTESHACSLPVDAATAVVLVLQVLESVTSLQEQVQASNNQHVMPPLEVSRS